MKRREPVAPVVPVAVDGVPGELLLGACIEYWAPNELRPDDVTDVGWFGDGAVGLRWCQAFRRYADAVTEYRVSIGLRPQGDWPLTPAVLRRTRRAPWSFYALERSDPERLAAMLARAGLPADWRPE